MVLRLYRFCRTVHPKGQSSCPLIWSGRSMKQWLWFWCWEMVWAQQGRDVWLWQPFWKMGLCFGAAVDLGRFCCWPLGEGSPVWACRTHVLLACGYYCGKVYSNSSKLRLRNFWHVELIENSPGLVEWGLGIPGFKVTSRRLYVEWWPQRYQHLTWLIAEWINSPFFNQSESLHACSCFCLLLCLSSCSSLSLGCPSFTLASMKTQGPGVFHGSFSLSRMCVFLPDWYPHLSITGTSRGSCCFFHFSCLFQSYCLPVASSFVSTPWDTYLEGSSLP